MPAKSKDDAGAAAQAYYEASPSSKVGELRHAQAQLADLHAKSFTESRRTGDGVPK